MGFIAIIFAALIGADYYVAIRIYKGMLSMKLRVKFWMVLTFFGLMTLIMSLAFGSSMLPFPSWLKFVLSTVGFCWMGIFVYLLLFCILSDIAHLIFKLCRVKFIAHSLYRAIATASVIALAITTSVYGFCNARCIKQTEYSVSMQYGEKLSGTKIVMISDLHLGSLGSESRLSDIVNTINAREPDLICISGDFFDTDFESIKDVEGAKATLKKLSATYGVYACLGNHDAGRTLDKMKSFLEDVNITLLDEDYRIIDGRFALVGRADASPIGGGDQKRGELGDFFIPPENMPVIVMDHNPARLAQYSGEQYLILSGHTHRGQMFPAGIVTSLMYEVDYGYYQRSEDEPHIIVSSGVGYWGMPMRVGTDSEIVSITVTNR